MKRYSSATPYIAVFILFRKGDKAAFLLRQHTGWMDGKYDIPAGKVEQGETYLQAAVRESKEEVGAVVHPKDLKHLLTNHRNSDDMSWVDIVFEAQKWQGELYNAEPAKHGALEWLDLKHLPDNVASPGLHRLNQIIAGHSYSEYNWSGNA